jgi:putative transposase
VAVLALAVALKREKPKRTAAQVERILRKNGGSGVPSVRTLQRHFARLELNTRPDGVGPRAFGRFEAAAPNDRWTGDALHGPKIGGKKAYLFAFIDDHSRALVGYRWSYAEDTLRLEAALRAGVSARGVPKVLYLDNGAAMVSKQLLRALAILGIRLTHSKPGQPAGRGKIERFFRTVRDQFLVELSTGDALAQVKDLPGLNELFTAWVETVYHHSVHSETGEKPLTRYLAAGPAHTPEPTVISEAFQWSEHRRVTKTATINLFGNVYQVDAALVGRKIEVVFDPLDMTELQVRYQDKDMGKAIGFQIRRHVHPSAANKNTQPTSKAAPTGIDYLKLVQADHQQQSPKGIHFANLPSSRPELEPAPAPAVEPEAGAGGEDSTTDSAGEHSPGQLHQVDVVNPKHEGGQPQ